MNPFTPAILAQLIAWFHLPNQARRLTISTDQLDLQVKRDGNKLVIVLIEISPSLRGSGYFGQFIKLLRLHAQIEVELPQPRLASYCERLNIPVILDEPFNYFS